jgi:formylglycine-generating enzyme required for sulfatase activity
MSQFVAFDAPSRLTNDRAGGGMTYQEIAFETFTVSQQGRIVKQERLRAMQYVEELENGAILEMIAILGGAFLMGSAQAVVTMTSGHCIGSRSRRFRSRAGGHVSSRPRSNRRLPLNSFGLHDMHDHLWAWCADPWREGAGGPAASRSC